MKKIMMMIGAVALTATMPVYAEFKDAVEMTGGEFVCSGDADWIECYDDAYEGDSCLRSGYVYYNKTSNLKLTVTMAEAGSISFWWKRKGSGWVSFTIDDRSYSLEAEDVTVWNKFTTELKAGTHVFQWNYQSPYTSNSNAIFIDKISIPGYEVIDPDSQDPDNTLWTTTDRNLYRSGVIGHGRYSYKTMTVKGKGVLSFKWRTSSEQHFDRLAVTFDGNSIVPAISGETEWTKVVYTNDAAGVHSVRWRYYKDSDTVAGDDCGYVKDVRWGDGTVPFKYDKTKDMYTSGKIDNNDQSEAELLISASSYISFDWKVSSQADHDFLRCYVDGELKSSISGETDWDWISCGGTGWGDSAHTIKFVYSKDALGSAGADCGYFKSYNLQERLLAWRVRGLTPTVGSGAWTYESSGEESYYLSAANTPSILPVTVSSNGKITFQYRAYESSSWCNLDLYVDGKCVKSFYMDGMSGEYWNSASYTIRDPGTHLIEWRASSGRVCIKLNNDYYGKWYTGTRQPWVIDMQDYVKAPKDDVGDKGWVEESAVEYYSGFRSGKIASNQTSRVTARVGWGGENLSFRWKTTGEHVGKLNFYVNGELKASLIGTTEEQYFSEYLSLYEREQNEFVWEYVNGEGAKSGEDFGWIYDVQWGYMGGSLEWGTLGSDEEEDPGWKEPVYHWSTVTNFDNTVTLTGVTPDPSGCLRFPAKVDGRQVVSIGDQFDRSLSWRAAELITEIIIPQGITNIGYSAFANSKNLANVAFPSGLHTIGKWAFNGASIRHIKVPEGVATIGADAFGGSPAEIVLLPSTLTDLATSWRSPGKVYEDELTINPFYGCASDCVFSFPRGNANYSVINGHIVSTNGVLVSGLSSAGTAVIPSCVWAIGSYAFRECGALRSVYVPSNVKCVCAYAFYKTGLVSVHIDSGVEVVHSSAFAYCNYLSSVTLSEGLKMLDYAAFGHTPVKSLEIPSTVTNFYSAAGGMTNLVSLTFKGNAPNRLGDYYWFWEDVPASAVVYVPQGSQGWRSEIDPYSEELPSSGYWPLDSSSYGRKIYWYGNEPSDWTDPWWNKMDVSFSDKGWTGLRGVYTSPGWKDTTYSSSVHTNSATITLNGPGIIALDVMATGSKEGDYVRIFIDGVEMDYAWSRSAASSYSSAKWSRFEYGIAEEGAHTVVVEYRVPNNYGGTEKAYLNLQNVVWTPKSSWVKPDYVWETSDNGDGTVTILSVSPAPAFDLVVPAFVNGKRVTGIGARYSGSGTKYFSESPNLVTSVTLPEGLVQINRYAFGGSRRLKSIDFPSTLTGLESGSFSGCYSLAEAILPEGVTQLESSLFSSCKSLRRARVPATVKSIGAYVFDYDTALEEIMFAGDCPSVYSDMLKHVPVTCQIKVFRGTTGWGEIEIPGIWMGHPISYVETPPHTVFFDANGGTCPIVSKTVYEQSVYSELPVPTIDDPHFCFDGWYTQREGGKKVVSSSVVGEKADHTLYAHWVTAYYEVRITTLHGKASGGFFEYGTTNVFRSPGIVTEGKTRYICLGSSSYPEQGNEVTIVMGTNTVTFAWDLWRTEHAVTVDPGANGSITGAVSGWFADGTVLDLRAVANEGYCVDRWTGDLAEATVLSPDRVSDIVRRGHTIGASFRTGSSSPKPDGGPYTEKVGDLVWTYIVSNGVAIVGGGSEAQPAIPKSTTGDLVIPTVLGDRPVRGIAAYAFNECRISSVRIPNAVTHIDNDAFWMCSLSSIAYPSSLEDIGTWAFADCTSLSSVALTMPNLRRIGKGAFSAYNWTGRLRSVSIVGTNLVIEANAFYKQPTTSVSISGRNIEIGDSAFDHDGLSAGSSDYASVSLTGSGIVLGKLAFADMRHGGGVSLNLTGVRSIGESAFAYMGHNAIYRQSSSGFWYTRGVTDISISSELKSAPAKAFEGGSIGKLRVDDVDTLFGIEGFWNCVSGAFHMSDQGFWYDLWVGDERILTLRIPEGVTAIPEKALYGIVLKSIEVPDSVVSLGSMAFGNCRATVQFDGLPPTCGEDALYGCSSVAYTDHESDWPRVIEGGKWMGLPAFHGQALDYAGALGVRDVALSTGAPQSWFIQSTMTHNKTTALQSAHMAGNGTSTLSMEIDGPVEMSYWWMSTKGTSGCGNSTQFSVDGTTIASISGNADWAKVETAISEGHHELVWTYHRGSSDYGGGTDCCAIADMTLLHTVTFDVGDHGYCAGGGALVQKVSRGEAAEAPLIIPHRGYQFVGWDGDFDAILENKTITAVYRQISIDEAINTPEALERGSGLHFTTGGNDSWYVVLDDFDPENYVARSGDIGNDQNSFVKTTVSGSGRLTFKWRADTEAIEFRGKIYGLDIATFTVDGEKPIEIFGKTADYVDVSVDIEGEGTHTLCWIYVKDSEDDGVEREDCVWLDEVAWTPDVQPIEPGGEIVVPEGKTAKEFADEVNKNKAQYLKWPLESPVSTDYLGCFTAVPKGDAKVEFVLNEEGTNQVVEATTAAKTNTLESVLSKTGTLVIGDPLIGFYYSLKQGSDVTVGDKADLNKLAGRDELSFPLTTDKPQYFYQSIVTPTPVPTK